MSTPASPEPSGTEPSFRSRPQAGNPSHTVTESDLWELDDLCDEAVPMGRATEHPEEMAMPVEREVPKDFPKLEEPEKPVPLTKPALPGPKSRLAWKISALEWLSLAILLAALLGLGGFLYSRTIARIPNESDRRLVNHFPVKGRDIQVTAAVSYWRKPTSEGKEGDGTRRGTVLVPVVEFASTAATGTVRVTFRDPDGAVMGDVVTKPVSPDGKTQIAATAGFEEHGMYAAYRAGQTKPWTAEIHEAPTGSTSNFSFQKLFALEISSQSR